MPTLSVVVCCYTDARWDELQAALVSLYHQTYPVDEVVVVVDHNEVLLERLRSHSNSEGFVLTRNTEHRGLSGARNTGARLAKGEIVAFLDDDAEATQTWAWHLLRSYADPYVLGVGGRVVPRFPDGRPRWLAPELDWVVGCTYTGHRRSRGPVRNLIGANMSFRRDTLAAAGGFSHELGRRVSVPAGCEETELCIRATRRLDGEMFYEPEAVVCHNIDAERLDVKYLRARCFAEGRSKAAISSLVRGVALGSEREYVTRTLTRAIVRELTTAVIGRRPGGLARARTIVVAFVMTILGYVSGRLLRSVRRDSERAATSSFVPARVATVDVESPIPLEPTPSPVTGALRRRAVVLVRERGAPRGVLDVDLRTGGLNTEGVAELVSPFRSPADSPEALAEWSPCRPAVEPSTSVVVATHNRAQVLPQTLDSLLRQRRPAAEIVVVDNAPDDDSTRQVVERLSGDTAVRYVREDRPGLARAHNRGLTVARGEIIAFTDDDVVADEGWIDALVAAFDDDPAIGCVTGLIFPAELETPVQEWIEAAASYGKGLTGRRFDPRPAPDDALFPLAAGRFGSGANMAFRARVLHALGGFDPALGAGTPARGGDDLAAFYDVLRSGSSIVYEPGAIVYHAHPRDYTALRRHVFADGVGLGAYVAHVVTRGPGDAGQVIANLARATRYVLASSSPRNARRPPEYPATLTRRELAGLAVSPWCYARSRFGARGERWEFPEPEVARAVLARSPA